MSTRDYLPGHVHLRQAAPSLPRRVSYPLTALAPQGQRRPSNTNCSRIRSSVCMSGSGFCQSWSLLALRGAQRPLGSRSARNSGGSLERTHLPTQCRLLPKMFSSRFTMCKPSCSRGVWTTGIRVTPNCRQTVANSGCEDSTQNSLGSGQSQSRLFWALGDQNVL